MPISMSCPPPIRLDRGRADQEAVGKRQAGAAERPRVDADRAFAHRRHVQALGVDLLQRVADRRDQAGADAAGIQPSMTAASKSITAEAATIA